MSDAEEAIAALTRVVNSRILASQTKQQRFQNYMIGHLAQLRRDLYKSNGRIGYKTSPHNALRYEIAAIKSRIYGYVKRYPWTVDYFSALHPLNSIEDCMAEFARKHQKNIIQLEQHENHHIALG